MFTAHTEWMEYPCFYVSAFEGISRITLLAGPYRTTEQAEFAVDAAPRWALQVSGDPHAPSYSYSVSSAYNGHHRSILGIITP